MRKKESILNAVVLVVSLSTLTSAQMDHEPGDHMGHKMMQMEQSASHDQDVWMDHFEVLETRLKEKMTAMKSAKGERKIAAMQDVIEELVAQRGIMRREMMNTMPDMMKHMSKYKSMKEGMESCPMMKTKSADNTEGGEDHSAHH